MTWVDFRTGALEHRRDYPWGCRHQGCDVCYGHRHKTHHVNLLTSLGETTTCGRVLNDVPGPVSPFKELVTCHTCKVLIRALRFKIYPHP